VRVWLVASAVAISACSLFVDLGPLAGGDASSDVQVETSADVVTLDGGDAACPPRMVAGNGFCIDATELSAQDNAAFFAAVTADASARASPPECAWKTSTSSGAAPGPSFPIAQVDWCDAFAYCAWAGKRLCGQVGGGSVQYDQAAFSGEWELACSPDGRTYPYGNVFDASVCNTFDGGATVPTGSPCIGGLDGLHDMAGNVSEWINSCAPVDDAGDASSDLCHDMGDSFAFVRTQPARCDNADETHRHDHLDFIGIRCCTNP